MNRITHKQAIRLKAIGYPLSTTSEERVSDVLQWIRDNHASIRCGVYPIALRYATIIIFFGYNRHSAPYVERGESFATYREAENALLDELITYLEEKQ